MNPTSLSDKVLFEIWALLLAQGAVKEIYRAPALREETENHSSQEKEVIAEKANTGQRIKGDLGE